MRPSLPRTSHHLHHFHTDTTSHHGLIDGHSPFLRASGIYKEEKEREKRDDEHGLGHGDDDGHGSSAYVRARDTVIHQGYLRKIIHQLFPSEEVSTNARRTSSLKNPSTGLYMELDLYLPNIHLSFEFQDLYHYVTSWYSQISLEEIQNRDERKNETARSKHHTLVTIPCWWDGSVPSLVATILFQRPDLTLNFPQRQDSVAASPIPLNPPMDLFQSMGVPGVGELMLASFPSNRLFNASLSVRNSWWIGEKYDGVRCCWNPKSLKTYTRYGTPLFPLLQLKKWFPGIWIDSEIWFGRGMFSLVQKFAVFSSELAFCFMRLIMFDVPQSDTITSFEERYRVLVSSIASDHPFMTLAFRVFCVNPKKLAMFIRMIISDGGEGLILNKPNSLYEHGKAKSLLKLKASRGDKEGIVLDVNKAKGVTLKLADGQIMTVQAQNVRILVHQGDIVTFSYDSYSQRSIPVNPIIFRIRTDISWEQVVISHFSESQAQSLNKYSGGDVFTSKPLRYWTTAKGKNMREFLVSIAKSHGLDALVPATWYDFPRKIIEEIKGGQTVLQYFGGYIKTLQAAFPDIGLDSTQFRAYALGKSWDVKKRRKWFSTLAEKQGLDPLDPNSWYKIANSKISDPKTQAILRYYSGSFKNALLALFPEIGLVENRFPRRTLRSYFEEFARTRHMEPLSPATWYNLTRKDFEQDKIGRSIVNQFKGGYMQLIQNVFPDIRFNSKLSPPVNESIISESVSDKNPHCKAGAIVLSFHNNSLAEALHDLFPSAHSVSWNNRRTRRIFLEKFAKIHAFDPSNLVTWRQHRQLLARSGTGNRILQHYDNNIEKMVGEFFPKAVRYAGGFEDKNQRQMFFVDYANRNGFDPLVAENWYSFPVEKLLHEKGAGKILYYYNNNVVKALVNLFPDVGLCREKFCFMPLKYWQDKNNRKKYLEIFAAENGLDTHSVIGWENFNSICCTICICKTIKNHN